MTPVASDEITAHLACAGRVLAFLMASDSTDTLHRKLKASANSWRVGMALMRSKRRETYVQMEVPINSTAL